MIVANQQDTECRGGIGRTGNLWQMGTPYMRIGDPWG
ncbi:MAG: hypothetical protein QG656_712 [Candidatus Hydrogenedentes bacterium]|nr:hypothetical protein [Candidatus Hydrogenedentota bacterium]